MEYMPIGEVKNALLEIIQQITNPILNEDGTEVPFTSDQKEAIQFMLSSNTILDIDGQRYLSMLDNIPEGYTDHQMYKMAIAYAIRDGIKKDFLTRFGV